MFSKHLMDEWTEGGSKKQPCDNGQQCQPDPCSFLLPLSMLTCRPNRAGMVLGIAFALKCLKLVIPWRTCFFYQKANFPQKPPSRLPWFKESWEFKCLVERNRNVKTGFDQRYYFLEVWHSAASNKIRGLITSFSASAPLTFWLRWLFIVAAILCVVGYLTSFQTSTHQMPGAFLPISCANQICLQLFLNVLWTPLCYKEAGTASAWCPPQLSIPWLCSCGICLGASSSEANLELPLAIMRISVLICMLTRLLASFFSYPFLCFFF